MDTEYNQQYNQTHHHHDDCCIDCDSLQTQLHRSGPDRLIALCVSRVPRIEQL